MMDYNKDLEEEEGLRLANEAIEARFIPEQMALGLAAAVRSAADRYSLLKATIEESDGPRQEQLTSAELRVQLEEMTRREKMWRKEAMRLGSEQAQASVQSFSEFCDGHKAGMRKALEVR